MDRYIGTFHKTGTVLLQSILRKADKRGLLKAWHSRREPEPTDWDVAFYPHAHELVPRLEENRGPQKVVVSVRDPRDIVVSACYYHAHSREKFLHIPRDDFDGKTYQEALNAAPTLEDKLIFEIENYSGTTIERMLSFPFERAEVLKVQFEDIVSDQTLAPFAAMFEFLEIDPGILPRLLRIAERNSLFSGNVDRPGHVRSGKAAQWRAEFTPRVMEAFTSKFPTAAADLGYPEDGWQPR